MSSYDYVLITAAYNEVANIGGTIEAILAQTLKPRVWVIVSDGSTDGTDSIAQRYAQRTNFIKVIQRERSEREAGFVSKVAAIKEGYKLLQASSYRFIGILDADITLGPSYYDKVISLLHQDPVLGIAGGFIYDLYGGQFKNRPSNTKDSVAGGIQLFRSECYETIGGHRPARFGGEDWICEIIARMNGWKVSRSRISLHTITDQAHPEGVLYARPCVKAKWTTQ